MWNPNASQPKITPALASPSNYVEASFAANSGTAYHLWLRMRAEGNGTGNDSVHVQFSDSVNGSGTATMQIGTSSSAEVILQNGEGDTAVHNWGGPTTDGTRPARTCISRRPAPTRSASSSGRTARSSIRLNSSQVFDVRDANGVMPSDHRPVMSIFTVK